MINSSNTTAMHVLRAFLGSIMCKWKQQVYNLPTKRNYISSYVESKAQVWVSCLHDFKSLASIALTQPHTAFAALARGLSNKWSYLCQTTPGTSRQLHPVDQVLRSELIPALIRRSLPNDLECKLFALPASLGGLGIEIPSKNADKEFSASMNICKALTEQYYLRTKNAAMMCCPIN